MDLIEESIVTLFGGMGRAGGWVGGVWGGDREIETREQRVKVEKRLWKNIATV